MLRIKTTVLALVVAATVLALMPADANADGPLRRWLRGLRTPKTACYSPTVTPNQYNLKPGQCIKTCQQTCSRTVVNYVPCTAYRTVTKRVPVTQYRPETTTDPCTGCTVTCMKPCTTYTYQCQRVPYTTYRPVYRQETYKVPVTTVYNDCANGACGTGTCATGTCGTASPVFGNAGCDTCVSGQSPTLSTQPNYGPIPTPAPQTNTYYESAPGISTGNSYSTPTGADQVPTLVNPTSSQRPVTERLNNGIGSGYQTSNGIPARVNIQETASRSPIHKRWSYSPVRLASYEKPMVQSVRPAPRQLAPLNHAVQTRQNVQPVKRNGWVEVN